MKRNSLFKRLMTFILCALVLLSPLPQAFATNEDDESSYNDENGDDYDDSSNDEDTESDDVNTDEDADGESGGDDSADTTDPLKAPGKVSGGLEDPLIEATAVILANPDTGMVLYEKNADEQKFPASTTKIMTAILTLENASLTDKVTAEASDFEHVTADSSNADIKEGETVTVEDLLYALMLPSANEAAYMLARHIGGTWENFVDMMNTKAEQLGCTGTHFSNPCGLHQDDHYTTARDLLRMAQYAMKDETFADIVSTVQHLMDPTNMHPERKIFTTNELIFSSYQPWAYGYCTGIKTGHTSQAGNCLVSSAKKGKSELYSVVMGCANAPYSSTVAKSFTETKRLFEWGFENFTAKTLVKEGEAVTDIEVRLSADTDRLTLTAKNDLVVSMPNNLEVEDMELTTTVPETKDAPIKAGDVIGSRTYSYGGVDYGTVELVALTDVELSRVLYYTNKLENFFKTALFKGILVVLTIFVVLYIIFSITIGGINRRQKKKATRKRYENSNYQRRRRK